ncbi:MAG TPA: ribonuclease HI [Desulfobacteraceae bacterium]|nr:ribonuclease HI [Desulfobacteraceae bacterium]
MGREIGDRSIEIFTDGACSGNPGPGGYAAIIRQNSKETVISGGERDTTNNRMELMAVIEALKKVKVPSRIRITTDSNYVVRGMKEWIFKWIKNGWKNSQKRPVSNRDLWETLLKLSSGHEIDWNWIRGHNGHPENERCNRIARQAINRYKR